MILVRDKGLRHTMEAKVVIDEDFGDFGRSVGMLTGTKCAYFVSLSMMMRMQSYYRDARRPSMKSIIATSHGADKIDRGWSKPGLRTCTGFAYWHTWQRWTKSRIMLFMDGHLKRELMWRYMTGNPE
jgi:hypothetical protein